MMKSAIAAHHVTGVMNDLSYKLAYIAEVYIGSWWQAHLSNDPFSLHLASFLIKSLSSSIISIIVIQLPAN